MGDSACLMHGFSYASAIPNDSENGNTMHALGESISFGRFTTDSLSWEKWSTFSHKKYVEEAERYAQPGSVAEKKAFFEAHYKRIAAKKAAALLEQQNAANILQADEIGDSTNAYEGQIDIIEANHSCVDVKMEAKIQGVNLVEIGKDGENGVITANESSSENPLNKKSVNQLLDNLEKQDTVSESESRGTSIMDRGLLKNSFANEDGFSSMKSPIQSKTWEVPSTPIKPVVSHLNKENNTKSRSTNKLSSLDSFDKRRSSPNSLRALLNLFPNNEPEEDPISATKKAEKLGMALRTPQQDCATPLRTPARTKVVSTYPAANPQSANKRITTPFDPPVQGSKTGSKWHILSAVCSKSLTACKKKLQSPTLSTPFILRTEERASKRKQKLEDKFNASDTHKMQLQKTLKERAGNEFSKLGCSFCFKARPSPDFYKERETPKDHMKEIPAAQSQSAAALGGNISNETQGTISLPSATKNLPKKNVLPNQKKLHTHILTERITHENASPNIRQ